MFNLLQDLCHCGRLVLLLSPLPVLSCSLFLANEHTRMHKMRFIKCFYEKFIEHKITQAAEFVFSID